MISISKVGSKLGTKKIIFYFIIKSKNLLERVEIVMGLRNNLPLPLKKISSPWGTFSVKYKEMARPSVVPIVLYLPG
jgi:hypothetical protein